MLSFPSEFNDIVSQEDLDVFDHGRYVEIVQMLSDLGYLTISAEDGKILDPGELKIAVLTFREEALSGSLISKSSLQMSFPDDPIKDQDKILTFREFSVLQLLVSLDGDFTLKPLSEISEIGIYIRVIQYRLHLMGLLQAHPDGIYTDQINIALNQLADWLAPVKTDELLDLTGNIVKLISHIKRCESFKNKIVYFNSELESSSKFYYVFGSNIAFLEQLKKDIDRKSAEYKELLSTIELTPIISEFLKTECKDFYGNFIVRLSQIAQWTSGYYLGKIDGEIGEMTFESLRQLGQTEVESGNTDFEMGIFVGYLSGNCWVMNPHYLFREITGSEANQDVGISEVFTEFNKSYLKLGDPERKTVEDNMRTAWATINFDQNANLKSIENRFRRIYFGARSLLQSFWRGFKNIFNKLKQKLLDFTSKMFSLIKNFAKYLYREIREALQVFSRGVTFLFGKREMKTTDCFTKFDFDMDSITCFSNSLTDQSFQEHLGLLNSATTGLNFCMTLTGRIVSLLIHFGLGWQSLIIHAGILLKQLVKECYSNKKFDSYIVDPQG